MSDRTQAALDLARDVRKRVDAHPFWTGEARELAVTLSFAVQQLALECERLQGQIGVLESRLRSVTDLTSPPSLT